MASAPALPYACVTGRRAAGRGCWAGLGWVRGCGAAGLGWAGLGGAVIGSLLGWAGLGLAGIHVSNLCFRILQDPRSFDDFFSCKTEVVIFN